MKSSRSNPGGLSMITVRIAFVLVKIKEDHHDAM